MRILFAGNPEIAIPTLERLHEAGHVCAVLTNPDRQTGRGRKIQATPVKIKATEFGIPALQPSRLGGEARREVRQFSPELLVVAAYGRIFGPKFLSLFPRGAINLHPSLLPRYRGPSPIAAAILNGDVTTGVTIQKVALETDSGDILAQEELPVDGEDTTATLSVKAGLLGARLVVQTISDLEGAMANAVPQDHRRATWSRVVTKADGKIDWNDPAASICRKVRAYNPWPTAYTTFRGKSLALLRCVEYRGQVVTAEPTTRPGTVVAVDKGFGILIQTSDGMVVAVELQLQSRQALGWRDFLNGAGDMVGSVLGG